MPTTKRLAVVGTQLVVGLLCLRGFLAGRTPPAFAQDVPRYSASSISPVDDRQDYQITSNAQEVAKLRERMAKQNDSLIDLKLQIASMDGKLQAQSNFWSMQNGGVGVGILAMLGFQVHPLIKARRKKGDEDE